MVSNVIKCIFGIYFLFRSTSAHNNLYVGDKCTVTNSNEAGICRFVEDCPTLTKLFKEKSIFPTRCGFERSKGIFCCPIEIITKSSFNSISSQRCKEYHDTLYETQVITNADGSTIEERVLNCPLALSSYIGDGALAEGMEFPHMV